LLKQKYRLNYIKPGVSLEHRKQLQLTLSEISQSLHLLYTKDVTEEITEFQNGANPPL